MMYNKQKRNTPIATLIHNYVDKKSGKVTVSRNEIQWRFWALDWKDQKKILAAFLEAGKTDRHWAYEQLLNYWDSSMEDKVRKLWEEYHEQRCKWVVIRYFPLDYVRQHMQDFTEERDYYFACLRLAKDKDFVIEREKLSNTDYLAVLYHSGREMDEQESLDVLYNIVHDYCVNGFDEYDISKARGYDVYEDCPILLKKVRLAIYYLERADCFKPVLAFEEWNEKVKRTVSDSKEFKQRNIHPFVDYDYHRRRRDILRKYAYLALDDKYKMPSDPSPDDFLKPVEEYSESGRTVYDTFSTSSQSDYILGPLPFDSEEEILPF